MPFQQLTAKQMSYIKRLQHKKYRVKYNSFVVEGNKSVYAFLKGSFQVQLLVATPHWLEDKPSLATLYKKELYVTTPEKLSQISCLKTQQGVLMVVVQPTWPLVYPLGKQCFILLDSIRDPGNMGTIIRIADWYGISNIIASLTTVDCYNPKVIQASMGSLARVCVHYTALEKYLQHARSMHIPAIGAVLHGESLHQHRLPSRGCLLIGNEAHGIDIALLPFLTSKVTIPGHGKAESLNAAVATAIICDRWKEK